MMMMMMITPTDVSHWLACMGDYKTTSPSAVAIYYYSARKLILILPSLRWYKAETT